MGGWGGLSGVPRRTIGLAVLAALVGSGTGVLVNVRTGEDEPSPPVELSKLEVVDAPTTTEPGTGFRPADAVEVVESGLTTHEAHFCSGGADPDVTDGCDRGTPTATYAVSYGVVIRNTSEHLLVEVPLIIYLVDAAGQTIDLSYGTETVVWRLLPGEEVGLGDITATDRGGATAVRVEVGDGVEWTSVDFANANGDVALASELRATLFDMYEGGDGEWTVAFRAEMVIPDDSTAMSDPVRSMAEPTAVLRDSTDRIVGGFHGDPMMVANAAFGGGFDMPTDDVVFPDLHPAATDVYMRWVR